MSYRQVNFTEIVVELKNKYLMSIEENNIKFDELANLKVELILYNDIAIIELEELKEISCIEELKTVNEYQKEIEELQYIINARNKDIDNITLKQKILFISNSKNRRILDIINNEYKEYLK